MTSKNTHRPYPSAGRAVAPREPARRKVGPEARHPPSDSSTTATPTTGLYDLTDDHHAMRDVVRQVAQERVAPRAGEIDEKGEYPQDMRELFAEHDLFALPLTPRRGTCRTRRPQGTQEIQRLVVARATLA